MYHATQISLLTELFEELEMSFPNNPRPDFLEPSGTTPSGIEYRQHGYGIFMQKGEVFVDMDFGSRGEVNGIHPHFLLWFAEVNSITVPFKDWGEARIYFDCLSIRGWLKKDRSGTVYYLRPSIDL